MLVGDPRIAQYEIVLISDDTDHARLLLSDLDALRHPFLVTRVSRKHRIAPTLKGLVEAAPRKLPMIVMLDFEFLQATCERVVERVLDMKKHMAVECVATRPPVGTRHAERLKGLGAFLFDPDAEVAFSQTMVQ
jgi:hypothetical protein